MRPACVANWIVHDIDDLVGLADGVDHPAALTLFEARRITCSLTMHRAPMARLFVNCRRRFAAPVDTPDAMLPASAVQIPQGLLEAMRWRFSHPGFGARAVGHFLALAGIGGPDGEVLSSSTIGPPRDWRRARARRRTPRAIAAGGLSATGGKAAQSRSLQRFRE